MRVRSIVLIEDHEHVRKLYATALRDAGFRVIERPSALNLVELVHHEQPEAVVMDLGLPGPDGLAACARLKRDREIAHVRVVLLTGRSSAETRSAGFAAGADDFLAKPVRPRILIELLLGKRPLGGPRAPSGH